MSRKLCMHLCANYDQYTLIHSSLYNSMLLCIGHFNVDCF